MKKYIQYIVFVITIICFQQVSAQTNSFDYMLSSNSLMMQDQHIAINSIITKTGNMLIWNQLSNEAHNSTEFQIMNSSEQWDITTSTGTISYNLTFDENQGSFTLENTESGIIATLSITTDSQQKTYTFSILTINYL